METCLEFSFTTVHVVKKAIASSNRASIGGHIVKKGVVHFLKCIRWDVPSSFSMFSDSIVSHDQKDLYLPLHKTWHW